MDLNAVITYRKRIAECGKRVIQENPDKLNNDELVALTHKIFETLNSIDMSFGHEQYDSKIDKPASIPDWKQDSLFSDFVDWYNIRPTGATLVADYVKSNYPSNKHKKIICVGDGENCHVGRKLANEGYNVVVMNPLSTKEFEIPPNNQQGKLHIVKGNFFNISQSMIDWADVIVGVKVTLEIEDLIKLDKPAMFTISNNPEIYNMRYNGVLITCLEQLRELIEKDPKVKKIHYVSYLGQKLNLYVVDGKDKEDMDDYSM